MTFPELSKALQSDTVLTGVSIDPDLASSILDANPANRPTRPAQVKKLARQLRDGQWNTQFPGMIAFNPDGRLVDGQHRLKAVVVSGVPITVNVLTGLESTVGLDESSQRSVGDHLALAGVRDAQVVARATKMLFNDLDEDGNAGASQQLVFYRENAAFLAECAEKAKTWLSEIHPARQIVKAGELAGIRALAIRRRGYSVEQVDVFLAEAVMGGSGEEDKSPAAKVFQLLNSRKERGMSTNRRVFLMLAAMESHVTGRKINLNNIRPVRRRRKSNSETLLDAIGEHVEAVSHE